MSLSACVQPVNGRPVLVVNGQPTTETWCYGWPNAIRDFAAAGLRICQFHVRGKSWWTGPGQYHFTPIEEQIDEFLRDLPGVLLIPRVLFGYEGEGWWAQAHPDDLSVGLDVDGRPVSYPDVRAHVVESWHSAGSRTWVRDASEAMAAFVRHFEKRYGEHILGYQIGGGVSCEWFRWWTYVVHVYEDYSPVARDAFRGYLRARYGSDAALRAAWNRQDVTLDTAEVPRPQRLHQPARGFLRDPVSERDVLDWLNALSDWNADQMVAVCRAAKHACEGHKLVGTFYGYTWPHWNNQNAARSGHMALDRVLACDEIDYISSPYHYDNRYGDGVHNSQTVNETIERAGKLHVDEIDTSTYLTRREKKDWQHQSTPKTAEETNALLRRDAAAMLGLGGNAWWMDLVHSRWYEDPRIQAEVRDLDALARQTLDWSCEPHAEVALVIDERSPAYCDLNSNLNLYFTSLPRQFVWSDLGFPMDTLLLSEIDQVRDYKLYVFLNCWHVDGPLRDRVRRHVRRPGITAVWFYASGYADEKGGGVEGIRDLTGFTVEADDTLAIPEIDIIESGHSLLEEFGDTGAQQELRPPAESMATGGRGSRRAGLACGVDTPRGNSRFGARLAEEYSCQANSLNPRGWDTPASPIFTVTEPAAAVLGHYVHNGRPGLACLDRDGWRAVYSGAPMLPGWLLRRIAATAGVHLYAPLRCVVHHRGPLVSVYARSGGSVTIRAPRGLVLETLRPGAPGAAWQHDPAIPPAATLTLPFEAIQTRFFKAVAL